MYECQHVGQPVQKSTDKLLLWLTSWGKVLVDRKYISKIVFVRILNRLMTNNYVSERNECVDIFLSTFDSKILPICNFCLSIFLLRYALPSSIETLLE